MSQIKKNPILYIFLALAFFTTGILCARFTQDYSSENAKFHRFTYSIFEKEVQGNTLSLHYTLAKPEEYGIHNYPLTLGTLSPDSMGDSALYSEDLLEQLKKFSYNDLSYDNQILYDTLELVLKTESSSDDFGLLYEPLSPTLGIQAQLPILLAEYTFRCEQDIKDYLSLLQDTKPYFEEILAYEQTKASTGLFMNEDTAQGVINQCTDFIEDKENHYLSTVFNDKIQNCSFLSERKKAKYIEKNLNTLKEFCFPAYELLIDGLEAIKNTGTNDYGLCHLPDGKEYYQHLVESTTGIYDSVETIEQRLYSQLYHDYMQIQRLYTAYPDIARQSQDAQSCMVISTNPEDILLDLQTQMQYEFPALDNIEYEVKYVNEALQEHLSPAFYLTPPIDTGTPNSIYLNPGDNMSGTTLYTTLAHEGFPGHLYQTQYFSQQNAHPLLSLLANGGYIEGWATYIESYAYQYAPVSYEIGQYLSHNRSFQLCLYSILDIGIHYHGWTPDRAGELLATVGIEDKSAQENIYQILLEDPANYLKYCAGSIYLQDIRNQVEQIKGKDFDIQIFHKKILETGPVPFPVLAKYLYQM